MVVCVEICSLMMLWSDYRRIDQLVFKRPFIRAYAHMDVKTYISATKTIIFDQGVRKYIRVTESVIFDQVYVTDHTFITVKKLGWAIDIVSIM